MKTTVDFRIIGTCHMRCPFCHGAPKDMPGESFDQVAQALEKLRNAGVDRLVLSGGEPLLRKDIAQVIKLANSLGFEIYLSTTGTMLFLHYEQIKVHLSWLGLSLDGSNDDVNFKMGRNKGHFEKTISILKYFLENPPPHRIRVGTVVSRKNLDDIINIGEKLFFDPNIYSPNVWRLYDFAPRGDGKINKKDYAISSQEFAKTVQDAKSVFGDIVSPLSNEDHDSSYFFVEPDLAIVTAEGEEFPCLGNLKTLSSEELRALFQTRKIISHKSLRNRQWMEQDKPFQVPS